MLQVGICDDERLDQDTLMRYTSEYCDENGIECSCIVFSCGEDLLFNDLSFYDVIFLDVNMPDINGIEVAKAIRDRNRSVIIVFITSFIEYAPRGYEVNAYRYILKDELEGTFKACMDGVMQQLATIRKRIFVKFVEGDISLPFDEIIYIESEKHKLLFSLQGRKQPYSLYKTLDYFEAQITNPLFLRIHKSFLVNLFHVRTMTRYQIEMSNGKILTIPKSKFLDVERQYILYKG